MKTKIIVYSNQPSASFRNILEKSNETEIELRIQHNTCFAMIQQYSDIPTNATIFFANNSGLHNLRNIYKHWIAF